MKTNQTVKRPTTVWITQCILFLAIIVGIPFLFFDMFTYMFLSRVQSYEMPEKIIELISITFFLILLILAFWGLQKRKQYGRWLGIIILVISIIFMLTNDKTLQIIYANITQGRLPPSSGLIAEDSIYQSFYSNYLDLLLHEILNLLRPAIMLFLAMRLALAQSVKRFFNS